jgi:small subunit ribosomal protein S20
MPNTRSAKKRMRQNEKRRTRNRDAKSAMKTAVKRAEADLGDAEKARAALQIIGKTASRSIIHPNMAARLAGRLQRKVNAAAKSAD